ncbi:MaoC family dehydratase [Halomarina halobia]|uniref:MaoC family dehydratase n=1 Tax=Halomarina halobia TaxID=3033386 RepID=A0ABD6AEV5_9EURY|nr:MaoC family dehydratase [Halomarina sp. PSR21]
MARSTSSTKTEKINYFEDFEEGQEFEHHWGRTINEGDNSLFSTLTMNANPTYFNADYAGDLGHNGVVANHLLAFNVVFGMSVQDLSEAGGAFLGVEGLKFHETVYPGDTLYADSEVLSKRESESRPHQGIVHWYTKGTRPDGELVLEYERKNLIGKREYNEEGGQ